MTVLENGQSLNVFHGPAFFKDPDSDGADNDTRAQEIASFVPNLRRVDHWNMSRDFAIIIEHDGHGENARWREVKLDGSEEK